MAWRFILITLYLCVTSRRTCTSSTPFHGFNDTFFQTILPDGSTKTPSSSPVSSSPTPLVVIEQKEDPDIMSTSLRDIESTILSTEGSAELFVDAEDEN